MVSWLIIAIFIIVALFALKMNRLRHKIWILLLIFIGLFLYISVAMVYDEHGLDFKTTEGIFTAFKVYLGWLGNGFENMKIILGNVIKLNWTATNDTFLNKSLEKFESAK